MDFRAKGKDSQTSSISSSDLNEEAEPLPRASASIESAALLGEQPSKPTRKMHPVKKVKTRHNFWAFIEFNLRNLLTLTRKTNIILLRKKFTLLKVVKKTVYLLREISIKLTLTHCIF
jgi:hypothetical protein